jgi:hypothetical protein
MLRVQGLAPLRVTSALLLVAAFASVPALAEGGRGQFAPIRYQPKPPPAPVAPAPVEPDPGWLAFSAVVSGGPLSILRARYPDSYPAYSSTSFTEVQANAGLDLAAGVRLGPVVLAAHAEAAYAGKPAFFAKDPLFVAGLGPRVELQGTVFRLGLQGSWMGLPRQQVFSLKQGVQADVGAQFGHFGLRLAVGYYSGTAQYPDAAGQPTTEEHDVVLVPVTLGVRFEL